MKTKLFISILLMMSFRCFSDVETNLPCGVSLKFIGPGSVTFGSNASWHLVVTNSSVSNWTYSAGLQVDVIGYNGELWKHLSHLRISNVLAAGSSTSLVVSVTSTNITRLLDGTLQTICDVDIPEPKNMWFKTMRTYISMPTDFLVISPATPVQVGSVVMVSVHYVNPFPIALQDVRVLLTANEILSTYQGVSKCMFSLGTIEPYGTIAVSTNYVVRAAGDGAIWAYITSSNLTTIDTSREVQTTEQKDGVILEARVTLKPEALEVSPGILTAFVRLPEGYPVSGITSATCDGAQPERMMPNEDGTEMIIKFRRQDIEKALAQIGQVLDTTFVVRGAWQGPTGTRLFQGTASIKKIVGAQDKKK